VNQRDNVVLLQRDSWAVREEVSWIARQRDSVGCLSVAYVIILSNVVENMKIFFL
jgi:hypothetical protein